MDTFQKQLSSNTPHTIQSVRCSLFRNDARPSRTKRYEQPKIHSCVIRSLRFAQFVHYLHPGRFILCYGCMPVLGSISCLLALPFTHSHPHPKRHPPVCVCGWGLVVSKVFGKVFRCPRTMPTLSSIFIRLHASPHASQPASHGCTVPRFDFFCVTSENRIKCCLLLAQRGLCCTHVVGIILKDCTTASTTTRSGRKVWERKWERHKKSMQNYRHCPSDEASSWLEL